MMNSATNRIGKPLDPADFPLSGTRLIDASAGTGKTYQIANLYVRLVLGLDEKNNIPLPVEKILVVTFTNAATDELRGRIRARLEEVLHYFRSSDVDGDTEKFLKQIKPDKDEDRASCIRLLNAAILSMDEASISTIHSFAVQAAKTFLFETGALADIEVSTSGKDRKDRVSSDLFREISSISSDKPYADEFKKLASRGGHTQFCSYFGKDLPNDFKVLGDHIKIETIKGLYDHYKDRKSEFSAQRQKLREHWKNNLDPETNKVRDLLDDELRHCGIDTTQITKAQLLPLVNLYKKNLDAASPIFEPPQKKKGKFPDYFGNWSSLKNNLCNGDLYQFFMLLRQHFNDCPGFNQRLQGDLAAGTLGVIVEKQSGLMLDEMSLDDVIKLINQKLKDPETRKDLQRIITQAYPVCLVDEFQDTDPEQFRMFNEIYSNQVDGTGFFMIGDPKQSIYSFRGADIFSYLNVRAKVESSESSDDPSIYSLDTNWRSKSRLVDSVNALFKEPKPSASNVYAVQGNAAASMPKSVFLFEGIKYQDVKSCEQDPHFKLKPALKINDEDAPPLVFIGNCETAQPNEIKGEVLQRKYARDTAIRIKELLHPDNGGNLETTDKDDEPIIKPVKPRDIAVLVRDRFEAKVVRNELARKDIGLRCVFVSQKDSIFSDSEIAEDIYHVLMAINEHSNKRRLKTALATSLMRGFRFDFNTVDELESNDIVFELLIEEFSRYKALWNEYGIMTALNHLLADRKRGLASVIADRKDSDRILTDFRHLADILQTKDQELGSAELLIDWYANQLDDDSSLEEDAKRIRLESDENLVKIVTIHSSKGLQYPIVFLPFFYLFKEVDLNKKLPVYHVPHEGEKGGGQKTVIDFASDDKFVKSKMQEESLAENMRLLYVAITRAMYQCYVGISDSTYGWSEKGVICKTVWGHLLSELDREAERQEWDIIETALHSRLEENLFLDGTVEATTLVRELQYQPSDAGRDQSKNSELGVVKPAEINVPWSNWKITSYSALAHGKKTTAYDKRDDEQGSETDGGEEFETHLLEEGDREWANNPRYTLKGSAVTGNCLHGIFEDYALSPADGFNDIVERMLTAFGLDKPSGKTVPGSEDNQGELRAGHIVGIQDWLDNALKQPLYCDDLENTPTLEALIKSGQVIPEMEFDFTIGNKCTKPSINAINSALNTAGLGALDPGFSQIHGLMTGSIDLVFIHDNKIYVLDYKSNTLGKSPRFYGQESMTDCMKKSQYDLQYMIYSVAVHRYFSTYFENQYAFDQEDDKKLSFGGVFYLFLRGMGLGDSYRRNGVWFTRPEYAHVHSLDQAFVGESS